MSTVIETEAPAASSALWFDGSADGLERLREWVAAFANAVVDGSAGKAAIRTGGLTTVVHPFDWVVVTPSGFTATHDIIAFA